MQTLGPLLWWAATLAFLLGLYALWWWLRRLHVGTAATQTPSADNSRRGLLWGLFVLFVALGVPVFEVFDPPKSPATLVVNCTASQWKWHFDYQSYRHAPVAGIAFFSAMRTPTTTDNRQLASLLFNAEAPSSKADELLEVDHPLVLPIGSLVRFVVTSEDTIHAWWIPAFNVKEEAIPGFVQSVEVILPNTPGTYRGMCSQLCGSEHAFMPIVVKLLPVPEFETWLAQQPAQLARQQQRTIPAQMGKEALLALGRTVYQERCELCHGQDGSGQTPRMPTLVNNATLAGPVPPLQELLLKGRNVMPGMRGVLARDDLAALASFLRLNWSGLSESDAWVQPGDLQTFEQTF